MTKSDGLRARSFLCFYMPSFMDSPLVGCGTYICTEYTLQVMYGTCNTFLKSFWSVSNYFLGMQVKKVFQNVCTLVPSHLIKKKQRHTLPH